MINLIYCVLTDVSDYNIVYCYNTFCSSKNYIILLRINFTLQELEGVEESKMNSSNISLMDQDELYASIEILEPGMQLFVVILYSCTALVALGGNGAAIAVLLLGKRRSIRLFLVNLALSDVTMAVFSIPFTYTDFVLGRWIFLPEFCPVVQFMQHASVSVSVYTLTVVGLDR